MSFFEKEVDIENRVDKSNKAASNKKFNTSAEQARQAAKDLANANALAKEMDDIKKFQENEEIQKQYDSTVDAQMAYDALPKAAEQLASDPNISQQQKEDIMMKSSSPKSLLQTAKELNHTQDSTPKESISAADQFKDALTFFAPQLLGGVLGGALEGVEGAVAGSIQGGKLRDSYIGYKQGQEEMQLKRDALEQKSIPKGPTAIQLENLKVAQGNLELRKQDIDLKKQRDLTLNEDRDLRREERDLTRAIAAKENFARRPEYKKYASDILNLDDMDSILNDAPEIAIGAIPSKIARGIAGEVGVLTDNDIKRNQISPSVWRSLKRGKEKYLLGKLPEQDVTELRKIVDLMRKTKQKKLSEIATNYANSRGKDFSPDIKATFTQDLKDQYGLSSEAPKTKSGFKKKSPKSVILRKDLSPEDRAAVEELKNQMRRNK